MRRSITVFILILLSCAHAWAAQRTFVSAATGDDANACTRLLPCRSFSGAVALTDPDGEVIALDSGGYGAVTIAQPVSLISPAGIHAAITATAGNAVTVNAGDTARVILRNLALSSQGASNGIDADTVAALHVEGCLISGFTVNGILFDPTTTGARLYVNNGVIRRSGTAGINVTGGTGVQASVESLRVYENAAGVYVNNAMATIHKTIAAGGTYSGFFADIGSKVDVEESVATNHGTGFAANAALMTVIRCESTSNNVGIGASLFSTIYVSDSTIALNATGLHEEALSIISSRGNNTLQANTTDGAFNSSFMAQ
jgi:hypothetical protein